MIETRPQKNAGTRAPDCLEKEGVSKWDLQDFARRIARAGEFPRREGCRYRPRKSCGNRPLRTISAAAKAESIKDSCQDQQVTSVIFDDELSPAQGRNLENLFRAQSSRSNPVDPGYFCAARTSAAKADCKSNWPSCNTFCRVSPDVAPLVTPDWWVSARAGPGETQLEVDRRRVQERIAGSNESWKRSARRALCSDKAENGISGLSLRVVGYTNAGKSTLLNLLTGAEVVTENNFLRRSIPHAQLRFA